MNSRNGKKYSMKVKRKRQENGGVTKPCTNSKSFPIMAVSSIVVYFTLTTPSDPFFRDTVKSTFPSLSLQGYLPMEKDKMP